MALLSLLSACFAKALGDLVSVIMVYRLLMVKFPKSMSDYLRF